MYEVHSGKARGVDIAGDGQLDPQPRRADSIVDLMMHNQPTCQGAAGIDRCRLLSVQDVGDGLEHQVCYAPVTMDALERRLGIKLKPHPDKVAEAAALSSLQAPPLRYTLALPKEILLGVLGPPHCMLAHACPGPDPTAVRCCAASRHLGAWCAEHALLQPLPAAAQERAWLLRLVLRARAQEACRRCRCMRCTWPARDTRPSSTQDSVRGASLHTSGTPECCRLLVSHRPTRLPVLGSFFLGDGPGVGKGRQIAALVTENILRKRGRERVRAMWPAIS